MLLILLMQAIFGGYLICAANNDVTDQDQSIENQNRAIIDFGNSGSSIFDQAFGASNRRPSKGSSGSIFGTGFGSGSTGQGSFPGGPSTGFGSGTATGKLPASISSIFGQDFDSIFGGSAAGIGSGSGSSSGSVTGSGSIGTASSSSGQCGVQASGYAPNSDGGRFRIINGVEANPHSWPWLVYLQADGALCGGSLIRSDVVLTAAHCLAGNTASGTKVTIGAHTLFGGQDPGNTIRAKQLVVHEGYDSANVKNDIALIKLEKPVLLSNTVRTVCLPASNQEPDGSSGIVAGWGRLSGKGTEANLPTTLQEAPVPLVSNRECQSKLIGAGIKETMICAGGKNKDSCQGDSGGPLMVKQGNRWTIFGITSFGPADCGTPGLPAVYTRVASYIDWINRNM